MPTIMICDNQKMFSSLIFEYITKNCGFNVLAATNSGRECINLIENGLVPDILILDVRIPNGISGYEVARYLKKQFPQIKILILSMHTDRDVVCAMIRLGVKGFLYKSNDLEEIQVAIIKILSGLNYYPVDLEFDSDEIEKIRNTRVDWAEKITRRELATAKFAATNMPNKLIADKLGITEAAVNKKIYSLSKKTKTKTKIGIIVFLIRVGILF